MSQKKNLKFKAEGKEFVKNFEITRTIYSNIERREQFLKQNAFLTYSWRFLRSNTLEQLEFQFEKSLGLRNIQEKLEKAIFQFSLN